MTTGQRAWWLTWVLTDPHQQPGEPARAAGSDDDHVRVPGGGQEPACRVAVEQSGKELADLGGDRDQPFMERIHGTRYYG